MVAGFISVSTRPSFVSFDQLCQIRYFFGAFDKFVLQELFCRGPLVKNQWLVLIWLSLCKASLPRTIAGSRCKQTFTKSLNALLYVPLSTGGGFFGIWNRTFIGCISAYGGSPLASSIAVIPKDQISAWHQELLIGYKKSAFTFSVLTLWSYPDCLITSGAIQNCIFLLETNISQFPGHLSLPACRRKCFSLWDSL